MKFDMKKIAIIAVALIAGGGLAVVSPPEGLDASGMRVLGILLGAVVLWAGRVLPEAATALIMSCLFVIIAKVPLETSFSAFSGSTFWLLVAAFGLGAAIKECGLLERISILLLKLFPKSYRGQVLGLAAVTTITSPLIPSKAAKCSILSPLTRGISDAMGYKNESREATGLFLSYYSATCFSPAMFISASVTTAALVGMYSPEIQEQYTMVFWALCALPWLLVMFVGNFAYISARYSPKAKGTFDLSFLDERLEKLGPWSSKEKIMGIAMALTIAMWIFKSQLGIPDYAAALFSLIVALSFDILPVKKWRSNVAWDSLIFIGCAVSLSTVLPAVGVTDWLVSAVGPYTESFFGSPILLIAGLAALTLLVRFLILSEIGYLSVFTAFLFPLAIAAGVNPWVVGFIMNAFVVAWFLPYQSSVYLTAIHSAGEGWVTERATTFYCVVYCVIALIASYVAYFAWQVMGIWSI